MSIAPGLQVYFMSFMPYADLPADHARYHSMWVDYPNNLYDPEKGHAFYTRYLSEFVLADTLGFDGLVVNEHHSTAYSMMPACSLIAAALIPQTRRAKICIFGTPVNLEYPNRLAEEYAMLDVMSGGRLELAFPLGTGMEYWSNATQLNPATARARFRESMDVVLKAWTEDGPSTFDGEFYNYRYLNVWPKPYQKPHPPIFVVGTGSPSTMAYAAEKGYGYSVVFIPIEAQLKAFEWLRAEWRKYGHEPRPDMITFNVLAYVGETDEEAEREGKPHILNFFNNFLRTTPRYLAPPGYVSVDEFRRRAMTPNVHGEARWEDLIGQNRIITGTPERVAEAIAGWLEQAGSNKLIVNLQLADMPHWKTVKNLTLFGEQVLPRLRKLSPPPTSANGVSTTPAAGLPTLASAD
jgi:alkanesulfonate monooxygenase SsuD/methylene tetrahydromethanopterin reductase-like flavin-dependent oxidoreductase (luciferase family)